MLFRKFRCEFICWCELGLYFEKLCCFSGRSWMKEWVTLKMAHSWFETHQTELRTTTLWLLGMSLQYDICMKLRVECGIVIIFSDVIIVIYNFVWLLPSSRYHLYRRHHRCCDIIVIDWCCPHPSLSIVVLIVEAWHKCILYLYWSLVSESFMIFNGLCQHSSCI